MKNKRDVKMEKTMTNFTAELNVRLTRKTLIQNLNKKPTQRTKDFIELVISTAKLINEDLAQGKFHLDLSDKRLKKEFNCTSYQAKNVRMKLQEMGLTYIPEGQKQYKPGTYPNWLPKIDSENKKSGLVIITELDESTRKKLPPVNTRYDNTYCEIYFEALEEIMDIKHWSIKQKMMNVHMLVNDELERKGLTRDDCRI